MQIYFTYLNSIIPENNFLINYEICVGGCDSHRCGFNAKCTLSEGRPVCSCLNLHMGDPLVRCEKVECLGKWTDWNM